MAFVKVVRRSMRPEEWTDLRYGWIKRSILDKKFEITGLEIQNAHQESEGTYTYLDEFHPLHSGDLYFTPDGTAFLRGHGEVPPELAGQEIWFYLHTAAEMIVKINGQYAGGIDPNRDRILLNPWLKDGSPAFSFEIEGFNRSKPDDERNPDAMNSRGCRQIFEGAYLCTIRKPLLQLYYDLTLLLDIAQSDEFDEDYRTLLNRELNQALNLIDYDTWEGTEAALEYIETHIYANTDFHSSGNVALVGHSHLDIAYYWRRMHVVQKNARTCLIQMRLMDQYPDFHYAHTQPYTYELLKTYYPDLFSELKKKIANGQFEPIGAMYVEPDCNVPSAESLIRQCLYGQSFYRREFGITVDNAWLPDVFGNSWILPQILKKCGVDYFVSNKMSTWNDTNRFPHNNFLWKGIDGTRVYACVPPTHFITWNMPSQIQENWNAYQDKKTGGQTLSMFGYGDGGSGATEEMIELMHRFEKLSVMPKTEHMRADEFLHKNLKDNTNLETWDGELYLEMHRGTFTTKSNLKAYNRRLEFKLRDAELLSSLRMLQGQPYPADELRECYKMLLLNQFHDILPGSHINPVYHDAMEDYAHLENRLNAILAGNRNEPALYWNTLNFPRRDVTFVEDPDGPVLRRGVKGAFLYPDMDGLAVASLAEQLSAAAGNQAAPDSEVPACPASWLKVTPSGQTLLAETPYYRVVLEPDGSFSSLCDRKTGREWVDGAFNRLHLYQDVPGMYDAWDILPNYKDVEYDWTITEPLHLLTADSTCATFSVSLQTPGNKSQWTMLIRFFAASAYIEVEHIADWDEKHRLVKAEFSCNVLSRELVCDTSAGYIKRETHRNTSWQQARFEVCHHKWCDFAEESGGIALINDGKYGLGVEEKGMSLSLLRSNIRPDVLSDIGHHDFCYVILPHEGNAVEARINEKAFAYNVPLRRLSDQEISIPDWKFDGLFLQSLKLSEDGRYLVFRLSEQDGKRGDITLPFSMTPLNMLEDPQGEPVSAVSYHPFELLTLGMPMI